MWAFSLGWPDLEDISLWLRNPMAFFDSQFVFLGVWIVIAWVLAIGITSDFLELALQPDEIAVHDSHSWGDSGSQLRASRTVSRSDILSRFVTRWTIGGIILAFFTSLSHVNLAISDLGSLRVGLSSLGLSAELGLALICYFLAGSAVGQPGTLGCAARTMV